MFTLPGVVLLLITVYIRPQEFIPSLASAPLLHLSVALAAVGLLLDLRLRRVRLAATPLDGWAIAFVLWCLLTVAYRDVTALPFAVALLGTALLLYLLVAHSTPGFRALERIAFVMLAMVLLLSFIGVEQGLSPLGCHRLDPSDEEAAGELDGRPCERPRDCESGDAEPGAEYACERPGLFQTSSIGGGRVRYRGPLNDPNELALAICIGLPFAFAFVERKRSWPRVATTIITVALVGACTVFTRSRGGQLVLLAVLGVYFVRRFGVRGLVMSAALALPVVLLGGRSGEEAESSSLERLDCWYVGMSLVREFPLLGVGQGQFIDHHTQTAHNSYILAAAELGLPGLLLFTALLYLSIKIPLAILRDLPAEPRDDVARSWAMAMLASQAGLLVGILFLSFCYHPVLWIYFGLTGALYLAVKRHHPNFAVKLRMADLLLIGAIDLALLAALYFYTRLAVA